MSEPPVSDKDYDRKIRRQVARTGRAVVRGASKTPEFVGRQFEQWLESAVDSALHRELDDWKRYGQQLRAANPRLSDLELARLVVKKRAFRNGILGAATSFGGITTLPLTVSADVIGSFLIQIRTAMAVACIFGEDDPEQLKTDVYLILAGEMASQALKTAGAEIGINVTKKVVHQQLSKEILGKLWKIIPKRLLAKLTEKGAKNAFQLVPIVAAPIGFATDYAAARIVGNSAIKYYAGD